MSGRVRYYLFLFGAAISLLIPALINGYPLVYSDTATYLDSGFTFGMPYDRPITYGLFLRFASLNGVTLWTVIAFPCLILAWLIFRMFREKWQKGDPYLPALLTTILLSLFTGLSWTGSQLMPDIFTPIMFLTSLLLLTGSLTRRERILLYLLFLFSASMHLSHLTFNVAFLGILLIIREIKVLKLKPSLGIRPIVILLSLSLLAGLSGASSYSKSKHIFLMGAFVEHGIVQRYLDEKCGTMDFQLCAYKDSLPELAWQFLWDPSSPLEKLGGWKETKEEFNEIIRGTLTSPKYLALHLKESLKATAAQLVRFKIGDGNGIFLEGTTLHERMELFMPGELLAFETSRQNRGILLKSPWINRIHQGMAGLSLLYLLLVFIRIKKVPADKLFPVLVILILLGVIIHAWTCGTFANAIDRLGTKMMWFIPLLAALSPKLTKKIY